MTLIDTNIDNWNTDDLLDLFSLDVDSSNDDIDDAIAPILSSAKSKNDDSDTIQFLKNASIKLKESLSQNTMNKNNWDDGASTKLKDWMHNQYLTQNDKTQSNKITNRDNQIQIFDDNNHFQMKQNQLGINQSFNVPVAQGNINPNLQNTVTKTVIIDSQYRTNLFPYAGTDVNQSSFNTDYTITLSETLQEVISMELYSIQIPKTWYNIDSFIGNSCFAVTINDITTIIYIEPGNYTIDTLIIAVNNALQSVSLDTYLIFNYSYVKSRFYFSNISTHSIIITFYYPNGWPEDASGNLDSCASCVSLSYPNNSFGWTIGYKTTPNNDNEVYITLEPDDIYYADARPYLYGPQYVLLVVDDFNKNRQSKGVITAAETSTKLAIPKYADADNLGCDTSGKPTFLKTAPRRLTQAQLFTINSIITDRESRRYRSPAPNTNDVLAVIPITDESDTIVRYGSDLESNKREYFGPVDIDRIRVQLLDDKGNVINLNGVDWSFTFKVTCLYQY